MPQWLIDTMLLTLFVVGTASRDYIRKHKRLHPYREADFDLLVGLLSQASGIIVTPNVLTETSNSLRMIREPARSRIAATFQQFIGIFEERHIASSEAALDPEFFHLWLTDAGILRELTNGHVLLTSDGPLYATALQRGCKDVNFNDLRPDSVR